METKATFVLLLVNVVISKDVHHCLSSLYSDLIQVKSAKWVPCCCSLSAPWLLMYCHMENICGLMRVAYFNMSDSTEECPPGFRLYQSGGVKACGRQSSNSGSCQSTVTFPSYNISYSQVYGRVVGYQYGLTDAISGIGGHETRHNNINSHYVSLTCGFPHQHIWTFMA